MQTRLFFILLALLSDLIVEINGLTVTSLNLWNHMFNWDVRKIRIREMITAVRSDTVAVQEVRGGADHAVQDQITAVSSDIVAVQEVRGGTDHAVQDQAQDLQAGLTSQFKWNIFRVANNVSFVDNSIYKDYPGEGLGLLSKIEILENAIRYLVPSQQDPDKNKRIFLHVTLKDPSNNLFNIIVVHLSYHRQQQCRNVEEIMKHMIDRDLTNVIMLGDFNTYRDYEGPVQMLLDGRVLKTNPCSKQVSKSSMRLRRGRYFIDTWPAAEPGKLGYTFSNMPSPGLESRPDRILVLHDLKVKAIRLDGDGSRYKQRYTASIHWERFCTILYSSYTAHQGASGYPCRHDCGPHGSCQCGVCVAVGNKDGCLLPHCDKCSAEVFRSLVIHGIVCAIVLFHLSYAVVVIFVVAGGSYGETLYAILGCNCCLMNPKLFTAGVHVHARRFRILRLCKCWPVFRLPPYVQLLVSVVGLLSVYFWTRSTLAPQLDLTYNVLPEEFFPSDHLMLTADIEVPK